MVTALADDTLLYTTRRINLICTLQLNNYQVGGLWEHTWTNPIPLLICSWHKLVKGVLWKGDTLKIRKILFRSTNSGWKSVQSSFSGQQSDGEICYFHYFRRHGNFWWQRSPKNPSADYLHEGRHRDIWLSLSCETNTIPHERSSVQWNCMSQPPLWQRWWWTYLLGKQVPKKWRQFPGQSWRSEAKQIRQYSHPRQREKPEEFGFRCLHD